MHPIEHLRYLARAGDVDDRALAIEAAYALSGMPDNPAMMVIVARRLVEKHERCAPLWWVCSSVLVSSHPSRTAFELVEALERDPSLEHLIAAIPEGAAVAAAGWSDIVDTLFAHRSDVSITPSALDDMAAATGGGRGVVVVEAAAASVERVLLATDQFDVLGAVDATGLDDVDDVADDVGGGRSEPPEVILLCRLGTRLAEPVVAEMHQRSLADGRGFHSVDVAAFDTVISATGVHSGTSLTAWTPDGPYAPELLLRAVGP